MSFRNTLQSLVASTAIVAGLAGCTSRPELPVYETNAQPLSQSSICTEQFTSRTNATKLGSASHAVIIPINFTRYKVVDKDGKDIDQTTLFPFYSIDADKALAWTNDKERKVTWEPKIQDDMRFYVRKEGTSIVKTNKSFTRAQLDASRHIETFDVGKYNMPSTNFNATYNGAPLDSIPAGTYKGADGKLYRALILNAEHAPDPRTGFVLLRGNAYLETPGLKLDRLPDPKPVDPQPDFELDTK